MEIIEKIILRKREKEVIRKSMRAEKSKEKIKLRAVESSELRKRRRLALESVVYPAYRNLNQTEQLTKLLDEIICIWGMNAKGLEGIVDYTPCQLALLAIRRAREINPNYPITALLAQHMEDEDEGKKN